MGVRVDVAATDERVLPHQLFHRVRYLTHLARYEFALEKLKSLNPNMLLDAGCGTGYGTALLGDLAPTLGIDLSDEAIGYAKAAYGESAEFSVASIEHVPMTESVVDGVVSFEVIEHIPRTDKFLREVRRVLAKQGIFIVSTPNAACSQWDEEADRPANPFHETEYTKEEFLGTLSLAGFEVLETWGQTSGPKSIAMRRFAMGVGSRLARGRNLGYWPPVWERAIHSIACQLLARTTWTSLMKELRVAPLAEGETPEFFVCICQSSSDL